MIKIGILIKEYLGYNEFAHEPGNENNHIRESVACEPIDTICKDSIMVDIEGLHVGPTRNFTRYHESALKSSQPTWTKPYLRPLIMHHNEKDGRIIGRIRHVDYTDVNTHSGTGALIFTANVPDKEGIEQIKDGRLMTVSVNVIGHNVKCSICEHDIAREGRCEHERGKEYAGSICYWDIYEMEGKELSYVIVPSDIYARNLRIYSPSEGQEKNHFKENYMKEVPHMSVKESNDQVKDLQESVSGLEKEKEELQSSLDQTKTELDSLKEKLQEKEDGLSELKESHSKELQEVRDELKEKKEELKEAKDSLNQFKTDLDQEKELKEELENTLVETKAQNKNDLIENYTLLRKLANRPEIKMESLKERTEESIKDAFSDLKEEMSSFSIAEMNVENPSLNNEGTNVNEKKKESNIDLEEGLASLFSDITNTHS